MWQYSLQNSAINKEILGDKTLSAISNEKLSTKIGNDAEVKNIMVLICSVNKRNKITINNDIKYLP